VTKKSSAAVGVYLNEITVLSKNWPERFGVDA